MEPLICNETSANKTATRSEAWGATIVSPVIMFIAGTLGNILALVVLRKGRSSNSIFYTMVAGLAWTDLTGIILTSPATVAAYLNDRKWFGGDEFCRFNGFVMVCFGLSTPLIVSSMAIERYLSLRCTFTHSKLFNKGRAKLALIAIWLFVIIIGILPLFGFGKFVVQYPCTWCFFDFHSKDPLLNGYGYLYASLNLAVLSVMVVCNTYVMFTLLHVRYLKKKAETVQGELEHQTTSGIASNKKRKQRNTEIQMFVLMCFLTTVFLICWTPFMVHILITITSGKPNYPMDLTTVRMASFNQTLDPWIYIILRRSLFKRFKKLFQRMVCCEQSRPEVQKRHAHDNHLRCYRKPCYAALPFQIEGQVTPSGRCVVKLQRRPRSFNNEIKQVHSLPDVMKDTYSKMPKDKPNPDVTSSQHARDLQFRSSAKRSLSSRKENEKTPTIKEGSLSNKNSSQEDSDSSMLELNVFSNDMKSSSEDEETADVFATKITDLSSDSPLVVKKLQRPKLASEATYMYNRMQKPFSDGSHKSRSHSIT
ncbi:prostaglandin E2 receptor EP3 subtype-like [Saccostrea echinata]|uniref:prostaglandin E2 receptor EP3 subtype-like n=1 Tax=Saccostrea echinata TaxID=191078 RepID=UPI002A824415|nr:prostaglandin E2 receptor EP3 subtype-like [Saccostrea echinata]